MDPATAAFNEWMQSWSPINKKISVQVVPGMGRGVKAEANIKPHERILSVPLKYVLTKDTINLRLRKGNPGLAGAITSMDEGNAIAFFLLHERSLGDKSKYARWINVLPAPGTQSLNGAIFWSAKEMKELEIPSTINRVRRRAESLQNDFRSLVQITQKHFTPDERKQWYSKSLFYWARMLVDTRAWNMNGRKYLVPVAGMFNHALDQEDLEYDWRTATGQRSQKFLVYHKLLSGGTDVSLRLDKVKKGVTANVYSDRACSAGDQLFESYGDNDNAIYLDFHGFIPEWNPYECYEVMRLPFDETQRDNLGQERRELIRALGLFNPHPPQGSGQIMCLHHGELSDKLLAYFAVGSMGAKQLAKCKNVRQLKELQTCAGSAQAKRMYADVENWVTMELGSFKMSEERLNKTLAGTNVPFRKRTALMWRQRKQALIRSVKEAAMAERERLLATNSRDEL
eukprot:NODE_1706_length_1634_cov_70.527465_g1626_i0.p1 GENE.NODE_1706_length_1634_cov_70.527465_g1626_i0~~NODE_1706_length_1634_cov_70.527465_g1626_i0.p1  ORF type:complete len:456 (-),score=76.33 NODE_1706_length_1634_cov_70.527465_g1626_i0:115-1482(-)